MYRDPYRPSPEAYAVATGMRLFFEAIDPREPLAIEMSKARALYRPLNVIKPELLDDEGAGASIAENVETLRKWRKSTLEDMRKAAKALESADPQRYGRVLTGEADFEATCHEAGVPFTWTGPPFVVVPWGKKQLRVRYRPGALKAWACTSTHHPLRTVLLEGNKEPAA